MSDDSVFFLFLKIKKNVLDSYLSIATKPPRYLVHPVSDMTSKSGRRSHFFFYAKMAVTANYRPSRPIIRNYTRLYAPRSQQTGRQPRSQAVSPVATHIMDVTANNRV